MPEDTVTEDASLQAAPRREHPWRQMSLNFDVLVAVMPWIKDRKDLLSFISTCSDLCNMGVSTLLGFHYVIRRKHISPFYQFLASKAPSSFLGLRSLYFSDINVEDDVQNPDVISALTDLFSRASNLQHIKICGHELHPVLYQALASLTSLCTLNLRVHGSDLDKQMMFKQLQSPLDSVEFDGTGEQLDVITALANFHRTLQKLTVSNLTFCHNSTGLSYANLTHLSLQFIDSLQLSILVPAFPGLRTLNITFSPEFGDAREEWRESNIRFQMDHPSQRWHLSSLTGDTGTLYMLGLQFIVPDVTVVNIQPEWDLEDIEDCLATLRPVRLSIYNEMEPFNDVDWVSDLLETSCNETVRFDLGFALPSEDTFPQQQLRLDSFFHEMQLISMSNPNLLYISIEIHGEFQSGAAMAQERNLAHDFLDGLEVDSFAAQAVQAIPTLKIAELVISTTRTRVIHWIFEEAGGFMRVPSVLESTFSPLFASMTAPGILQAYRNT